MSPSLLIPTSLDFQTVGPDLVSGPMSRAAETNGLPASGSPTKVQISRTFGIRAIGGGVLYRCLFAFGPNPRAGRPCHVAWASRPCPGKSKRNELLVLLAVAIAPFALAAPAAAPQSDLVPVAKRAATVELASKIARQHDPVPLPADYPRPFNPPGFDQRDPEEEKAKTAAAQVAAEAAKPAGDRQILEAIAPRITPDGTAILPRTGESVLFFRQKKLKVGDHLTIAFDGHDYEVEITAIDRTTFTMRLNRAEITRPIQPGKTP